MLLFLFIDKLKHVMLKLITNNQALPSFMSLRAVFIGMSVRALSVYDVLCKFEKKRWIPSNCWSCSYVGENDMLLFFVY
jgi:hypothetical protein